MRIIKLHNYILLVTIFSLIFLFSFSQTTLAGEYLNLYNKKQYNAAFRLGGAILVPLLSISVLNLGWEKSSMIVGIMIIVIIMLLTLYFS